MYEASLNILFNVGERSKLSRVPRYGECQSSWRAIPQGHTHTHTPRSTRLLQSHFAVFGFSEGKQSPMVLLRNLAWRTIIMIFKKALLHCYVVQLVSDGESSAN